MGSVSLQLRQGFTTGDYCGCKAAAAHLVLGRAGGALPVLHEGEQRLADELGHQAQPLRTRP